LHLLYFLKLAQRPHPCHRPAGHARCCLFSQPAHPAGHPNPLFRDRSSRPDQLQTISGTPIQISYKSTAEQPLTTQVLALPTPPVREPSSPAAAPQTLFPRRFVTSGISPLSRPPRLASIFVCAMLPFLASSTKRSTISGSASATRARVNVLQNFGRGPFAAAPLPPASLFPAPLNAAITVQPVSHKPSTHPLPFHLVSSQKQTGEQPSGSLPFQFFTTFPE
jgi:hypothetical protein